MAGESTNPELTPEQQKTQIKSELKKQAYKACYMIHKAWWEIWKRYVKLNGDEPDNGPYPGYITNTALVYL